MYDLQLQIPSGRIDLFRDRIYWARGPGVLDQLGQIIVVRIFESKQVDMICLVKIHKKSSTMVWGDIVVYL